MDVTLRRTMANGIDPVQSMKALKYKGVTMRGWVVRTAIALAVGVIAVYGGICVYMDQQQDALIYPGGTTTIEPLPAPDAVGLSGFEAVTLDTPDGDHLKGWWHDPEPGRGVVLYLHGNLHSLAADWRVARLRDLAAAGYGVLGIEYRGFGGSTGHPSEQGLITDAETAYALIATKAPGAKVALFADSLGTGVAVALAGERNVAGLVLDSPYASVVRLASANYPWLPVSALLRSSWNSEARIKSVTAPVLIAHCDADRIIPLAEGKRLFEAANQPKQMIVLPGCGHVETWVDPVKQTALIDFAAWIGGN
jgi:fermentation-respiration switch protein FrsA (DUF1100 family)